MEAIPFYLKRQPKFPYNLMFHLQLAFKQSNGAKMAMLMLIQLSVIPDNTLNSIAQAQTDRMALF